MPTTAPLPPDFRSVCLPDVPGGGGGAGTRSGGGGDGGLVGLRVSPTNVGARVVGAPVVGANVGGWVGAFVGWNDGGGNVGGVPVAIQQLQ